MYSPRLPQNSKWHRTHCHGAGSDDLITLPAPKLDITANSVEGEIITIDHFGNAITSIGTCHWQENSTLALIPRLVKNPQSIIVPNNAQVNAAGSTFAAIQRTYAAVQPGTATPVIGSSGQLEIAVNQAMRHSSLA